MRRNPKFDPSMSEDPTGKESEERWLAECEGLAGVSPRSKFAKEFRKLKLEKLFCSAIMSGTNPNNAWFAEQLGVTTRTIRNYWKERLGPEKIYLHSHNAESGKESVELLTLEACAKRLSISVTELRKRIRAQYA